MGTRSLCLDEVLAWIDWTSVIYLVAVCSSTGNRDDEDTVGLASKGVGLIDRNDTLTLNIFP